MSLSLVEFPLVPFTDIPGRLRLLVEQIEDGDFGVVTNVVCVIETTDDVRTLTVGLEGDQMHTIGVLHFAAANLCDSDE